MSIPLYKCVQCGKIVTSDITSIDKNELDWFILFENTICSKKCYDAKELFIKSLLI